MKKCFFLYVIGFVLYFFSSAIYGAENKNLNLQQKLDLALLYFANKGDTASVEKALSNGADVDAQNIHGWTALMIAMDELHYSYSRKKITKLFLNKGADLNIQSKDGMTALILALTKGDIETAELLLANGADINAQNKDGVTALMVAAIYGNKKIVKVLLNNGADINAQNTNGVKALDIAQKKDYTEIAELLKGQICKSAFD